MKRTNASSDESLTELQRQELYLSELPKDFEFPLFSGRQAIESQRRSGYKTTARAVRELIDNAFEAAARNIYIALDRVSTTGRKKNERRDTVSALAVIDDGPGMVERMTRYALSWGGGTHFRNPTKIAKFGFGLPNSSINQTRRLEVYSKTTTATRWHRCVLDINAVPQFGMVTVPPAEPVAELPSFVATYLSRRDIRLESGTIVVWQKPDRLTYSQGPALKQHLRHDFGTTYRGLLDAFKLWVEDDQVKVVDPLFLTPGAVLHLPSEQGGAQATFEKPIPVKYWREEETGAPHLTRLGSEDDLDQARGESNAMVGVLTVRVARLPVGFASREGDEDAKKRLEIRKQRRGLSVMRAGREIDTIETFPTSPNDRASGLGDWHVLEGYDYHWAAEVGFTPELDEAFGVGNDKQTVRPIEDFWRVLHEAEVDAAISKERTYQRDTREERKRQAAIDPSQPNPALDVAAQAEKVIGTKTRVSDERKKEAQEKLEAEATERAAKENIPLEAARDAINAETKRKRFRIQFFEADGGVFYRPSIGPNLIKIVEINRAHPFFKDFYSRLPMIEDRRARQAIDLLLIALAKAELEADDLAEDEGAKVPKASIYEHDRKYVWTPFLSTALRLLDQYEHATEDVEDDSASAG